MPLSDTLEESVKEGFADYREALERGLRHIMRPRLKSGLAGSMKVATHVAPV